MPARSGLTRWVWALAVAQLAVLLAASIRHGYHRDELYFVVAGSHPAFGYPDQPPLVPLLCWALNTLAPGSLLVLRTPSALAAAATTVLAGMIAREAGGVLPVPAHNGQSLLVPVWIAGLRAPFRHSEWRVLRFLPITYAVMAVLYFVGNGHAYYLASLYPLLLGLGAGPTADGTGRAARHTRLLGAGVALSAALSALIALPVLPERDLQGSVVIALNSAQGDTVGWPAFVHTTSNVWRQIPLGERRYTAIFTGNYGEAGAIDLLGPAFHLPRAYSGHNGFSEWAEPPSTDAHALVIGFNNATSAAPYFARCRTLATVNDRVGLNNQEQGLPIMLCRATAPWAILWPHLKHYD